MSELNSTAHKSDPKKTLSSWSGTKEKLILKGSEATAELEAILFHDVRKRGCYFIILNCCLLKPCWPD